MESLHLLLVVVASRAEEAEAESSQLEREIAMRRSSCGARMRSRAPAAIRGRAARPAGRPVAARAASKLDSVEQA